MKQIFNYFYKIENKINGKFYYGVHKTNDLDDGYMGSGTRIYRAIIKYGIENFNKEILLFFDSYNEALDYESEIVNEQLLLDPSCYNLKLGGDSHWNYYNSNGLNKKGGEKRKGRAAWLDLKTNRIIVSRSKDENDSFKKSDRYVSPRKGKVPVKDGKNNIFVVSVNDERYLNGELKYLWKDRKHSLETRKKMSLTHQKNNDQQGEKNSQYGKCWITNGKENKSIFKGTLIPNGWKLGRKIK